MQGNSDGGESVTENTLYRLWAKHGTNALLGLLIFFATVYWNDSRDEQKATTVALQEQSRITSQIQSDVRNINTRLDEGVVKQVAQHQESIRRLEERMTQLERKAKLP